MAYFDTGNKIKEVRESRNLTQDQLAELASLNRVTIAKYESGKVEPGAHALSRIADALEISSDVLLGRSEPDTESMRQPKTAESRIISECVDRMPAEAREKALSIFKAVYSEYFESTKDKMA